jgi:hypothetical protein
MFTIFACFIIFFFYYYKKIKHQFKKDVENWKGYFICLLGISLSFITDLNLTLPMPTDILTDLVEPVYKYFIPV